MQARQAEDAPAADPVGRRELYLRIWRQMLCTKHHFSKPTSVPTVMIFLITQLSQTTGLNAGSLKGCSHQTETYHFFDNIKNPMRSGFVTHEWTNPTCPAFHWSHNFKHKPLAIPGVNNQVPVIAQRCLSCHKKRPDVATKREEVNQAGDAGARPQELISFSYFRRCTKV